MYYYNLKNGKKLCYSTDGYYEHPELPEGKLRCQGQGYPPQQGRNWVTTISDNQFEELKSGDRIQTVKRLFQKVTQGRKDLKCHYCEKVFLWKGYKVWLEKNIKPGKTVGGLFIMGREDKRYWTRWFNKKGQQIKFVKKFLEKERPL